MIQYRYSVACVFSNESWMVDAHLRRFITIGLQALVFNKCPVGNMLQSNILQHANQRSTLHTHQLDIPPREVSCGEFRRLVYRNFEGRLLGTIKTRP